MAGLLDEISDYMVKQSIDRTDPKKPSVPLSSQVLSALQGASNAAATNLSAPVDGIAWLLRKAGVPIPSNPVGGSDWMAQQGLTREPQNRNAGLLGEAIGGVLPMVAAAKAPQIAKGLLQVEANAMAPRTLNKETGAIVWHGSPHKFDKFDASKIGTGEGAQAYGHGLYLAESPEVAKTYKAVGTDASYNRVTGGMTPMEEFAFDKVSQGVKGEDLFSAMQQRYGNSLKTDADFDAFDAAIKKAEASAGSLYKVDLPDEHIAKMLDWDKPLSQQPQVMGALGMDVGPPLEAIKEGRSWAVRNTATGEIVSRNWADEAMAKKFAGIGGANSEANLTGKSFYEAQGGKQSAADFLRSKGIPGIRYLDGGSRGTGAGTSNFVVFPGNEHLLQILERNGQGLLGN